MSMMVMELNGMKMRTLMGMTTPTLALVTDRSMDTEVSQAEMEMVVWSRWNMVRTEFHFTLAERLSLVPAPSPTSL